MKTDNLVIIKLFTNVLYLVIYSILTEKRLQKVVHQVDSKNFDEWAKEAVFEL